MLDLELGRGQEREAVAETAFRRHLHLEQERGQALGGEVKLLHSAPVRGLVSVLVEAVVKTAATRAASAGTRTVHQSLARWVSILFIVTACFASATSTDLHPQAGRSHPCHTGIANLAVAVTEAFRRRR
jgi:hypothetical protein